MDGRNFVVLITIKVVEQFRHVIELHRKLFTLAEVGVGCLQVMAHNRYDAWEFVQHLVLLLFYFCYFLLCLLTN